jgi:hypothetical protein
VDGARGKAVPSVQAKVARMVGTQIVDTLGTPYTVRVVRLQHALTELDQGDTRDTLN